MRSHDCRTGEVLGSDRVRILVVDDDRDQILLLSRFLESHGCEIYSSGDGLQALDLLARQPVDLVIADVVMPVVDGIALLETLRADPKHKNLPVILVTGHPDEKKADMSLRKGAAFFLPKPVELDRLLALVRFAE